MIESENYWLRHMKKLWKELYSVYIVFRAPAIVACEFLKSFD
jgi:hypothetical protein